ncbi:MAG: NAD(P)/FAD-dependent oxidoreductase, partial [Clostridia bacterium]|nr:NAD(P)/FAD-dependent oxidoreductase [Clostridia bacterium]
MSTIPTSNPGRRRIAVVGGGAAGLMAAIRAAEGGAEVTLYEQNDRVGKKLRITGKGRCNVTNDCGRDEFLSNVPTNPRFLYAALAVWGTEDTKAFFEELGVPLKTERGKRVFPVSDRAGDVVAALEKKCVACGVHILHKRVQNILVRDGCAVGVVTSSGEDMADAVI